MGCDIHCYIEYKRRPGSPEWSDFGGRINPGRNYRLFAAMAGVRNYDDEITPVAERRGFPSDAAYASRGDNSLYVVDKDGNNEDHCSRETAERWVNDGSSKWTDERRVFVTNPDWHSHSWLTPDEFERALGSQNEPEYRAILAALRSFEAQGFAARLVFWFDN